MYILFVQSGTIFDIKKYSINDGPGIRTTVFLKGCPLCCQWCHNPESQAAKPEVMFIESRCIHCGLCLNACPTYRELGLEMDSPRGRIYLIKDMLEQDRPATRDVVKHIDRCLSCLSCMTTCPSGVHYMHLVDQAREHIEHTYKRPLPDRFMRALLAKVLTEANGHITQLVARDNEKFKDYIEAHNRSVDGVRESIKKLLPVAEETKVAIALENVWNNWCVRPELSFDDRRGGARANFDQQPIEAHATISACIEAYHATGDMLWAAEARRAFEWFLGRNDLGLALYDPGTGGCRDGLHPDRVNRNQGGESTLAFLLSLVEMQLAQSVLGRSEA